jgi:hypothetical protein
MLHTIGQFTFKENEISLKEFHQLSDKQKSDYVLEIMDRSNDELSNIQKHIVRFYSGLATKLNVKHFYSLDIEG